MADPPIPGALCYEAVLVNTHTGKALGTGIDCLETAITKQEVQKWLADYEQAWAAKDTKQLMQIGGYSPQMAAQANQVLAQYLEYRVELTKGLVSRLV